MVTEIFEQYFSALNGDATPPLPTVSAFRDFVALERQAIASDELYPVDRLGQVLLGDFLVPFEIVSVLLLVVMIGAAYLAKGRRREEDDAGRQPTMSRRAREWS